MSKKVTDIVNEAIHGMIKQVENARMSQKITENGTTKEAAQAISHGNPFPDKYSAKERVTQALFRKATGIGLDPEVRKALSGPMKAAALMFITHPELATSMKGAEVMYQLFSNVEGTDEMVS